MRDSSSDWILGIEVIINKNILSIVKSKMDNESQLSISKSKTPSEYRFNSSLLLSIIILEILIFIFFIVSWQTTLENILIFVALIPFSVLFYPWAFSLKVTFTEDSISYYSIFNKKIIRWRELEEFYYQSVERSMNFIPIGTYYKFKLIDSKGERIYFGNRVGDTEQIGKKIINASFPIMYKNAIEILTNNEAIQWGPVYLDNEDLIIEKFFESKVISLKKITHVGISKGEFIVFSEGLNIHVALPIGKIPNVFVLLELIKNLTHKQELKN